MFAPRALTFLRSRIGGSSLSPQLTWNVPHRANHWQSSLLGLRAALPMRAMPPRKKKVDPRKELLARERLKRRIKRLEKIPPQLIPIEDFDIPFSLMDEKRVRPVVSLPSEETDRRELLLKKWSAYRQKQHKAQTTTIQSLVEAQTQALEELRLECEELYQAAIRPDDQLFPIERQEPLHSPPISNYEAPNGRCMDVTPVYTQQSE